MFRELPSGGFLFLSLNSHLTRLCSLGWHHWALRGTHINLCAAPIRTTRVTSAPLSTTVWSMASSTRAIFGYVAMPVTPEALPHWGRSRYTTTSAGLRVTSSGSTPLENTRCGRDNPSRSPLLGFTNHRESSVVDKRVSQIRYPIGSKPFISL